MSMSRLAYGVALLAMVPSLVFAQASANPRQGFWVGVGLGLGSSGADCSDCTTDRTNGMSGYLRLGGTISRSLLVGVESNGWVHSESGVDETLGFGSVVAVWYPSATGGFFLKVGLGAMSYKAADGVDEVTATGAAGSFGLGYDFRVSKNMSITPFLNSLATSNTDFKWNGETIATNADFKVNLVQVGVGLTWH
jgi:hypothetical protein